MIIAIILYCIPLWWTYLFLLKEFKKNWNINKTNIVKRWILFSIFPLTLFINVIIALISLFNNDIINKIFLFYENNYYHEEPKDLDMIEDNQEVQVVQGIEGD